MQVWAKTYLNAEQTMTETLTVFEEHQALLLEHREKKIREAVEKAKQIVESATEHSERVSWFKGLEGLLSKYHRRLPRTLVCLAHSGLDNPVMKARALSLDPLKVKYWCYGSQMYDRTRFPHPVVERDPADLQFVGGAIVAQEDLSDLLNVLEVARERDLSSQVFIPRDTAFFEYQACVYKDIRKSKDAEWVDGWSDYEISTSTLDMAIRWANLHLERMRGIATIREARLYMPGLNQVVQLGVDKKVVSVAQELVTA
jgi:hypothetical protein